MGDKHRTHIFFSTFRALPGYPSEIPECPAKKIWLPWFRGSWTRQYWKYTAKLYRSTAPICNAVPCWLLSLEEKETPQYASHLYHSTPPICTRSWAFRKVRGPKKHRIVFNINFCPHCGPPEKMMCLISWERTRKKGIHVNFFRGILGSKRGSRTGHLRPQKV